MACMEGLPMKLTSRGREMDPNTVIALESVLCGITFYLCVVQWTYVFRKHVCRDCKSKTMIQSILLASTCVIILVSEIVEIVVMIIWNEFVDAREKYCIALTNIADSYNYSNDGNVSMSNLSSLMRYCNISPPVLEAFSDIPGCPELVRRKSIQFDAIGKNCSIGAYTISVAIMYGVIWRRQRSIYMDSALAHLSNRLTRFISRYLVVYMLAVIITVMSVTMYRFREYSYESGADDLLNSGTLPMLLLLLPWSIQLPMLALFILPLIRMKGFNRSSNIVTHPKYIRLMKRLIAVTAACLVSDTALAISTIWYVVIYHFRNTFLHMNFVINLICVNLIATDWKSRLFPWCSSCCRTSQSVSDIASGVTGSENMDTGTPP